MLGFILKYVLLLREVLLSTLVPELHYDAQYTMEAIQRKFTRLTLKLRPIQRIYNHAKLSLALPSAWPIDARTSF